MTISLLFSRKMMLLMTLLLVAAAGCEYDAAEPVWYKEYAKPAAPVIHQLEPAVAIPGVNIITIQGANFSPSADSNVVYFDAITAQVTEATSTMIRVRRPNLGADSSTVKVATRHALTVAKYSPYKVDRVLENYGAFVDNLELSALAVDKDENLYVVEYSKAIRKLTPDGSKTLLGTATRTAYDASIGPDGHLYLTENNRAIDLVNTTTGAVTVWTRLPTGKVVKYGDFDSYGNFYTGGTRSDLIVVHPDLSVTYANAYAGDDITAIRAFKDFVYVVSRTYGAQDPIKIWKHPIDAAGNVGAQELVFDLAAAGTALSSRSVRAIAVAANGILYLATDAPDPLLVIDPAAGSVDLFYGGIVPSYGKDLAWGNRNYLYLITGNAAPAQDWAVYRADMGITNAL